jgi:hypothetical protein
LTPPRLELDLLPGRFAVCRLPPEHPLPPELLARRLVSLTRTAEELSIVCAEELAPAAAQRELGFSCLRLRGPLPFSLVGVVAAVTAPLAAAGVSVFVVSTYDTDYLLVKETQLDRAAAALAGAGHRVSLGGRSGPRSPA